MNHNSISMDRLGDDRSPEENFEPIIISIASKRSFLSIMMQHAIAGISLFVAAISVLSDRNNGHQILVVIEAVIWASLVIAIVIEVKQLRKGHVSRFPFVEIMAGLTLFMESINKFLEGHVRLSIAWFIISLITIIMGFARPQISRFRRIFLYMDGILIRKSPFQRFRKTWNDIKLIQRSKTKINIITHDNKRDAIFLSSLLKPEQVIEELFAGLTRLRIPSEKLDGFSKEDSSAS
jgi:hypothetical protein